MITLVSSTPVYPYPGCFSHCRSADDKCQTPDKRASYGAIGGGGSGFTMVFCIPSQATRQEEKCNLKKSL